jgi:hypothetical protein
MRGVYHQSTDEPIGIWTSIWVSRLGLDLGLGLGLVLGKA